MQKEGVFMSKFSIIIPAYNVETYIGRCLDSICRQKYNDFEVIIVDDGSTDKTEQVVSNYIRDNNRLNNIRLIHKDNEGASAARNSGLQVSSGEFIVFMDADDIMLDGSLCEFDSYVSNRDVDLYVFAFKKNNMGTITESDLCKKNNFIIESSNSIALLENYLENTDYMFSWQPWAKVFKRSIIENNNIQFDTRLYSSNDYNFFFKYFLHVHSLSFCHNPVVVYTEERPGSITSTKLFRRAKSNLLAASIFFDDAYKYDPSNYKVLDFTSYIFLSAIELCYGMEKEEIALIKEVVKKNQNVYKYSKRKMSHYKRVMFYLFGFKNGAKLIQASRSLENKIFGDKFQISKI